MIKATIIADSIAPNGCRITTFEFEYPRFIHSEVMTHRMLSKNAASSRAIPVKTVLDYVQNDTARPLHWGKNQPGMQAREELEQTTRLRVQDLWMMAMHDACDIARDMDRLGAHKQIVNRITEPFQHMRLVVTGTEWANFFHLRAHPDAQPEFQRLAESAKAAMEISIPKRLNPGEWHLPYVVSIRSGNQEMTYWIDENTRISTEDALMLSASLCAQVSYRKANDSLEKAREIFDRLINSEPCHASPVEHQATPMPDLPGFSQWPIGVTHRRRDGTIWSGNFQGWVQYRQTLPNHTVW